MARVFRGGLERSSCAAQAASSRIGIQVSCIGAAAACAEAETELLGDRAVRDGTIESKSPIWQIPHGARRPIATGGAKVRNKRGCAARRLARIDEISTDFCNKICQKPTCTDGSACDRELVKACGGSRSVPLLNTTPPGSNAPDGGLKARKRNVWRHRSHFLEQMRKTALKK